MTAARAHSKKPILLIDTNVILDVILARMPWADDGVRVLDAIAKRRARGFMAAHSVTTAYYVVEKARGRAVANSAVSDLLGTLSVVPLEDADFSRAMALGLGDFEDAVQVAAHLKVGADYLITRNAKDFKGAPVVTLSAGELVAILSN